MKKIILISLTLIALFQTSFAINTFTPLVKANSDIISIREGEKLHKDAWRIAPEVILDIFTTNKFNGKKNITFITDIDSITFEVTPNNTYDFVILLNGKRAHTQISTFINRKPTIPPKKISSYVRLDKTLKKGPDKIPFTIGKDHRIYIKGNVNNSEPLNLLFDTGANSNVITQAAIKSKVKLKLDGETENGGSDGVKTVKTSSNNRLEINGLAWNDLNFLSINYQETQFDGILGWTAFENKIVEINYDKKALFIHDSIDSITSGYSKLEMKILRGLPYLQGTIVVSGKEKKGWFEFDTGSDWSLSLSQKFASEKSLNNAMKIVGKQFSSGSTGVKYESTIVLSPKLKLGELVMYQVPISISKIDPKGVVHNDILGNRMLKRFNAILDFKNFHIYLKPNNLIHTQYLQNLVK